jgi:hypothetical protein
MTQRTIKIRAFEQGGEILLYLIDSGGQRGVQSITTKANPGDEIIWKLDTRSNIKKIISIESKSTTLNVFSEPPSKVTDAEFTGTIAPDAQGIGAYNIKYKYRDDTVVLDDPFIEVDPPGDDD